MTFARMGALLCAALCLAAGAAEPRLDRIEPQGVRRGEEVVVTVFGGRIGAAPQDVLFYEQGIELKSLEAVDKNQTKLTLAVAPDCPLGRHALRVRTETGLSNLRTLHVGLLERVAEAEPNNTLDQAQSVTIDRTVLGVVRREDVDVFAVEVGAGERLSVEIEGQRLGRLQFDPVIELLDAEGKLLAKNDDQAAAHQDAFLSYVAPEEQRLLVRLRESAYRGDDRASYLLHIGRFPRPTAVYPPVAEAGQETELRWIGDAGGAFTQSETIPAEPDTHDAYATDVLGSAPSSLPVRVVEATPVLEAEPNNKRDQAVVFNAPGAAAGVIGEAGDVDHFRFTGKKDQVFEFRLRARELRSQLDSVMRLKDAAGKNLVGNDDDQGRPDSYFRHKLPADGEYVVQVEDRLKRGGEGYVYMLDVAPVQPAVDLRIDERRRYEATTIEVPRGGRTAVLMTANRRDVGGVLSLSFDELPEGVTAECFPLAGNYNRVPVIFSATAESPLAAALSSVTATLEEGSQPVESRFSQQTWLVRGRNNVPVWSHFADRAPVAVTQEVPFSITLAEPKAPLCKNGSTELRVTAERGEGFDQAISVKMLYHSPGVSSNQSRQIKQGETVATIPTTANGNARTGDWPIAVVGETNLDGRVYVSTQFVTLNVAEAYFDVAVPSITAKQGDSTELVVTLTPRTEFEGAAKLELVGLPPGVSAEPIEVVSGAENAAFQLRITKDARVGRHRGVGCRVRLEVGGEPVVYRHAYSELCVDPVAQPEPAGETAQRDEDKQKGTT